MDENTKYEIKADAFHRMRGMLAPGKDAWMGPSHHERMTAWSEWLESYGCVIDAMLQSVEYVLNLGEEE